MSTFAPGLQSLISFAVTVDGPATNLLGRGRESKTMAKSYRELMDERADGEAGEHLNVTIVSFETEGQEIVGEFKHAELLESTKYDNPVQRYLINTDDGIVSCLLGSHTDKEVLPKLQAGDLVKITFKGQKEIGGGKTVNLFDVQSFGQVDEVKSSKKGK